MCCCCCLQVLKVWNGLTQILTMPLRAWLRYVVVCLMVFLPGSAVRALAADESCCQASG